MRAPASNAANSVATALIQFTGRSALALAAPAFLAPSDYGGYAYAVWLMSLATQTGQCGLTHAAQRYIPLLRDKKLDASAASFLSLTATGASVVAFAFLLGVTHWIEPGNCLSAPVWVAAALTVLASTYGNIRSAVCQGYGQFGRITRMESRALAVRLAALALFVALRRYAGIVLFLIADLATQLVRATFLAARTARDGRQPALPRAILKPMLAYAATIWSIGIFDMLLCQRVEVGFLKSLCGFAAAGHFGLASQLAFMLAMFPAAAVQAVFPTLASMSARNPGRFSQVNSALLTVSCAAAAPLYFAGCAALPLFISVYKQAYAPAIPLIPLVCLGRVLLFAASPLSTGLYASGHHRVLVRIIVVTTGPALLLDYVLIRWFGLMGAGFAAAIVQPCVALLSFFVAHRVIPYTRPLELRTICVAVLASGMAAYATFHPWAWLPASASMLAYCVIAWRDSNVRAFLDSVVRRPA